MNSLNNSIHVLLTDDDDTFYHGAKIYITKPDAYYKLKKVLKKSLSAVFSTQDLDFDKSNFVLKI